MCEFNVQHCNVIPDCHLLLQQVVHFRNDIREFPFPTRHSQQDAVGWVELWEALTVGASDVRVSVFLSIDETPERIVGIELLPTSLQIVSKDGRTSSGYYDAISGNRFYFNTITENTSAIWLIIFGCKGLSQVLQDQLGALSGVSFAERMFHMDFGQLAIEILVCYANGWICLPTLEVRPSEVAVELLKLSNQFQIHSLWESMIQFLTDRKLEWFDLHAALDMFRFVTGSGLSNDYGHDLKILATKGMRVVAL